MLPTVVIRETGLDGSLLSAQDVRDTAHIRRLCLQAMLAVEQEGIVEQIVPRVKLELLRGFLANIGATNKGSVRRLLLMALLQLEDEDDEQRFVMPHPVLPVIAPVK